MKLLNFNIGQMYQLWDEDNPTKDGILWFEGHVDRRAVNTNSNIGVKIGTFVLCVGIVENYAVFLCQDENKHSVEIVAFDAFHQKRWFKPFYSV